MGFGVWGLGFGVWGLGFGVWGLGFGLHAEITEGRLHFDGASDAMIVSGLIAVLRLLYNGLSPAEIAAVDARAELARLGLNDHLSAQRSNGLRAMVERIRETAARAA